MKKGGPAPPYPVTNICETMLYHNILLRAGPVADRAADEKYPGAILPWYFEEWGYGRLVELMGRRDAFSGITRKDYHWREMGLDGVTFDVRHLGAGRVRIEVGGAVVRDLGAFLLETSWRVHRFGAGL